MSHETVIDDHRLLTDFCESGSQHAFSEIVHRYRPLVVSICQRVLGDLHHAEDATQATFIALARKAPTLRVDRTLAGWLYVAALASARELRRALQRRRRHEQAAGRERIQNGLGDGIADESTAIATALDDQLAALPDEQREALILRYVQGHSEAEAAALLDCPVRTLHNRVARGLARLRERLRILETSDAGVALPGLLAGLGHAPAASLPGASLPALPLLQPGRIPRALRRRAMPTSPGAIVGWSLLAVAAVALPLAASGILSPPVAPTPPQPEPPVTSVNPEAPARPPVLPPASTLPAASLIGQFAEFQTGDWNMTGLALGDDGLIWTCGYDRLLASWDPVSHQSTRQLTIPGDGMRGMALSPDRRTVALALANQVVVLHELASGAERTLTGHHEDVTAVAFTPDGQGLVSGSKDGSGILWDVASGTVRAHLDQQHDHVWGVAAAPDGSSVVLVGDDHSFWSYDAHSGLPRTCFSGYHGVLRSAAYAPDGACLASGGDGGVCLWNQAGTCLATLDDHQNLIDMVAFSGDGRWLAAGSLDGRIVIWDLASRQVLARAQAAAGGANCLAFAPDRRSLISTGTAPMRIWQLGANHP